LVGQTPKQTFDAVNNVREWSEEFEDVTDKLGAVFMSH
jgi:hypothetical protein